ncbi:hypothetical protein E1295_09940 [Nonomuraea mesophila]|uniref:GP-PDE domain-containing protein n=1 Tax=Nonomuraea mesophila TaxID=2530382 RepID=A0A4R5FT73_9ACTN|nr:hypothetical protein [Nonomuraea mesophila]TDE56711.1 hypothetical protein E1295_09940 [Nonomuraea mesophila]
MRSATFALASAAGLAASLVIVAPVEAAASRPCPLIFGHGGYPSGARGSDTWSRDQVRQPNNPTAIRTFKSWGASGVEADLQLTRDGTKAVMWHNTSTWGLTGRKANINKLWWAAGSDRLKGRTITRGAYKGETVHTFRGWLAAMRANRMIGWVEIKPEARQSLLSRSAAVRTRAWREVLDPVRETYRTQEVILYSRNPDLQAELTRRVRAAGMARVLSGRPTWADATKWEEPPPSWRRNVGAWKRALNGGARRIATDYTPQLKKWLNGQCGWGSSVGDRVR